MSNAAMKTMSGRGAGGAALDAHALALEPSAWLPRLVGLLDEQRSLCVGLDALSVAQSNAVNQGSTEVLLRVLGERQAIIDRVGRINGELEAFRAQRERALSRLSASDRRGVEERIESIAKLVSAVCERDERDRCRLQQQRDEVARELGGVGRGRGAVAAYGAGAGGAGGAKFQDRQA